VTLFPLWEGQLRFSGDGVVCALQVRDWAETDLTQFAKWLSDQKLERKNGSDSMPGRPVSGSSLCRAFPVPEQKAGPGLDESCASSHIVLRNSWGTETTYGCRFGPKPRPERSKPSRSSTPTPQTASKALWLADYHTFDTIPPMNRRIPSRKDTPTARALLMQGAGLGVCTRCDLLRGKGKPTFTPDLE